MLAAGFISVPQRYWGRRGQQAEQRQASKPALSSLPQLPLTSLLPSQLSIPVLLLGPAGHQRHHHLPQRSPIHPAAHGEEVSSALGPRLSGLLPRPPVVC